MKEGFVPKWTCLYIPVCRKFIRSISKIYIELMKIIQIFLSIQFFIAFLNKFAESEGQFDKSKLEFRLYPDKLNMFFHQTAIIGLLKAKSEHCLRFVSFTERILFRQCSGMAKSPIQLAKCISKLLKARDSDEKMRKSVDEEDRRNRMDLFSRMMEMMFSAYETVFGTKLNNKMNEEENEKENELKLKKWKKMRRRWKRNAPIKNWITKNEDNDKKELRQIWKFKRIQKYFEMAKYASAQLSRLNQINSEYFKNLQQNAIEFKTEPIGQLNGILAEIEHLLDQIHFQKFSILSPKIFPLFRKNLAPENIVANNNYKMASLFSLSPSLFSFSRDGFLSLPDIFEKLSIGKSEELEWLDLMLSLTDAGKKLDKLMEKLEPKIADLENRILPSIRAFEEAENNWAKLHKSMNGRQQREMTEKGYTFLRGKRQQRLAYGQNGIGQQMEMARNEQDLEEQIHQLAEIDENAIHQFQFLRQKRQIDQPNVNEGNENRMESFRFNILQPFAFSNQFSQGVVVQGLILSPYFWTTEILSPDILTTEILAPNAFGASILSANILTARLLSPTAFGLQMLSPEILAIYILTPEALFVELLAPNIMTPRIASPEYLSISLLSPNVMQPRIAAVDEIGLNILSPNILSPRFNSSEKFMIEILSPHILGGEHETSDEEILNEEEDKNAGHEVHEGQQHGGNKDAPHSEVAPGIVELGGDLSNDNFANNNENIKEGWSPNPKVRGNRKENNIGIGSF